MDSSENSFSATLSRQTQTAISLIGRLLKPTPATIATTLNQVKWLFFVIGNGCAGGFKGVWPLKMRLSNGKYKITVANKINATYCSWGENI